MDSFNFKCFNIKHHTVYDHNLEPVFQILSQPYQPRKLTSSLSQRATIPYNTLYARKRNLDKNYTWRPNHQQSNRKLLTLEVEQSIKQYTNDHFRLSTLEYLGVLPEAI